MLKIVDHAPKQVIRLVEANELTPLGRELSPQDVDHTVTRLRARGLRWIGDGRTADIALADMTRGVLVSCGWLTQKRGKNRSMRLSLKRNVAEEGGDATG